MTEGERRFRVPALVPGVMAKEWHQSIGDELARAGPGRCRSSSVSGVGARVGVCDGDSESGKRARTRTKRETSGLGNMKAASGGTTPGRASGTGQMQRAAQSRARAPRPDGPVAVGSRNLLCYPRGYTNAQYHMILAIILYIIV